MYRMLMAAAAAVTLAAGAGAAHAGDYGYSGGYGYADRGGYSDGYSAAPCGCQDYGYENDNYGYDGNYDIPFLPSESYSHGSSYEQRSYDYSSYGQYDRGYGYDRSYDVAPGYGHYTQTYDYDHGDQPRRYSYRRSYHYTAPRYPTHHYNYRPRDYGHSSRDGERG